MSDISGIGIPIKCGSCGASPKQIPEGPIFPCEFCGTLNHLPFHGGQPLAGVGQFAVNTATVTALTLVAWCLYPKYDNSPCGRRRR